MFFRIVGGLREIETIAKGRGIRELRRLRKRYGAGNWRKRKGLARIELSDNTIFISFRAIPCASYQCSSASQIKRLLDKADG